LETPAASIWLQQQAIKEVKMPNTSIEENKALVRRFAEAINQADHQALDELLAPDFVRHCQATPEVNVRSLEAFKRFDNESRATFPDQHIDVDYVVAEGNLVAFYGRYSGTQRGPLGPFPPSAGRMEIDISGVFRVADGKLAELWITWDNLAGLAQLAHWPPPAAPRG
jgi:predicted ester cyclase